MTKNRIAVIDADGLLFAAALKGETSCDGKQMEMRPLCKSLKDLYERIDAAMKECGAEECYLALSDRRNFRYEVDPTYKGNRKDTVRPLHLDGLRAAISEDCPHRVFLIAGLEADDVAGIMSGVLQAQGRDCCIHSPDKDLGTIPGKLFQKGKLTTVTQQMADDWHIIQTLAGDTTDGYKGCPGWGVIKAGRLLDTAKELGWSPAETWEKIVRAFEDAGKTKEQCLTQARLSRILRVTDWDAKAKKPILFQFPEE